MTIPTHDAATALAPGTPLCAGRFVIDSVLGRGGFGVTYAATDTRLHRQVAVKEVAATVERERFLREARVLARFNHPGIVRVFEVFEEAGRAYLVLELVRGRTLAEIVRERGPLPEAEVLEVARTVGGALATVHGAGLLHRDVSPSNLIVTGSGRIVLIDFGLARDYDPDRDEAMTRIVTPGYAPPEQYAGAGRFGPPTDVYGLAATLYRLLTGRTPAAAVDRARGDHLAAPSAVVPGVSRLVGDAVLDGLELDPGHRPQTVEAFLARLGVEPPEPATAPAPTRVVVPAPLVPAAAAAVPAPTDWGAYVPGPRVGPPRRGRWIVSLPLGAAAVSLCSAAPVLVAPLVALVGLPLLATLGDVALEGRRRAWAVGRFLRNVGVGAGRAVPALVLLGVSVALWYPLHAVDRLAGFAQGWLRLSGLVVGLLLVVPGMRGTLRFASGIAVDAIHLRVAHSGRRPTRDGWILLVAGALVTAVGLALTPEVWPLPS